MASSVCAILPEILLLTHPLRVQKPTTSLSVSQRQDLANAAADTLGSNIDSTTGTIDGTPPASVRTRKFTAYDNVFLELETAAKFDPPRSAKIVTVLALQSNWMSGSTPPRQDKVASNALQAARTMVQPTARELRQADKLTPYRRGT